MRQPAAPSPVEERNRGLQRLRSWTVASAALAAGLVVFFAFLAAGSFPGHSSDAAAAAPQAQTDPSSDDAGLQPVPDQAPPQAPPQGFFGGGGGGRRGAVSGGS
jgi:hypothetical protein